MVPLLQYQRVTNYKLVFGLQSGFELLRSKVGIDDVAGDFPDPPSSASGQTIFKNGFITLYSNIGRRFIFNNLNIDLAIGTELGFNIISREKGEATTNNNIVVQTHRQRNGPGIDFRFRSSLTIYHENWGISTGYSYGLRNYSSDLIGGKREKIFAIYQVWSHV